MRATVQFDVAYHREQSMQKKWVLRYHSFTKLYW